MNGTCSPSRLQLGAQPSAVLKLDGHPDGFKGKGRISLKIHETKCSLLASNYISADRIVLQMVNADFNKGL